MAEGNGFVDADIQRDPFVSTRRDVRTYEPTPSCLSFDCEQYRRRPGSPYNRGVPAFFRHGKGSALEVETQLELGVRLHMGVERELKAVQSSASELVKILNSILSTMRERKKSEMRETSEK
jgi:hypothetical protein